MSSEVYRDLLSAQIQPNEAKLIGWCFTVHRDNDPTHTTKATQEFLKQRGEIFCSGPVSLQIPACLSLAQDTTEGRRETHKQATSEDS